MFGRTKSLLGLRSATARLTVVDREDVAGLVMPPSPVVPAEWHGELDVLFRTVDSEMTRGRNGAWREPLAVPTEPETIDGALTTPDMSRPDSSAPSLMPESRALADGWIGFGIEDQVLTPEVAVMSSPEVPVAHMDAVVAQVIETLQSGPAHADLHKILSSAAQEAFDEVLKNRVVEAVRTAIDAAMRDLALKADGPADRHDDALARESTVLSIKFRRPLFSSRTGRGRPRHADPQLGHLTLFSG